MLKRISILFLALLMSPVFSKAQMYIGPLAGITNMKFSGLYQLDQYVSSTTGLHFALNNSFQVYDKLYADLRVGYIEKGASYNFPQFNDSIIGTLEGTYTFSYIEFPVTLQYKFNIAEGLRFCPGIGLYAGLSNNWSHYQKITNRGYVMESTDKGVFRSDGPFNKWDLGIMFQGAIEIDLGKDYLLLGINYQDSWTDLLKESTPGNFQPRNQGAIFYIGFMYNWEKRYF